MQNILPVNWLYNRYKRALHGLKIKSQFSPSLFKDSGIICFCAGLIPGLNILNKQKLNSYKIKTDGTIPYRISFDTG